MTRQIQAASNRQSKAITESLRMMLLPAALLTLWILPVRLSAQDPAMVHELQRRLAEARTDSDRISVLTHLSRCYFFSNPDSVRKCGEAMLAVASRGGYPPGAIKAYRALAQAHFAQGAFDSCLADNEKQIEIASALGDERSLTVAYSNIGKVMYSLDNDEKALEYLLKAAAGLERLRDSSGLAETLLSMANVYARLGLSEKSHKAEVRALTLYQAIENMDGVAGILHNMGVGYYGRNEYRRALSLVDSARMISERIGNKQFLATGLTQLAMMYVEHPDLPRLPQSPPGTAFDVAKAYLRRSISIYEELQDSASLAPTLIEYGNLFLRTGEIERGQGILKSVLGMTGRRSQMYDHATALRLLAASYEKSGQYRASSALYKRYIDLADSLRTNDMNSRIANLQRNYEITKRENTIKLLTAQAGLEKEKADRNRLLLFAFLGAFVLACVGSGVIYHAYRAKQRSAATLAATLDELQATQARLIHADRMATLGELTAGIAHEIRNPLNFINNFASISKDLFDDLRGTLQEHSDQPLSDAHAHIDETLSELETASDKIRHHGQRADAIVTSMLMHARGTVGMKVPSDINQLLDTAIDLSYHGMRAGTQDFNARMEREFDPYLKAVPVVPQEISRVFLNILQNAYAALRTYARDRSQTDPDFEPTVSVATARRHGGVEIRIRDNGPGIPEHIRDKIFNPFFTTKPPGEGTGLGLSISYDIIVKGHGGSLEVYSNHGAEFVITLPG